MREGHPVMFQTPVRGSPTPFDRAPALVNPPRNRCPTAMCRSDGCVWIGLCALFQTHTAESHIVRMR